MWPGGGDVSLGAGFVVLKDTPRILSLPTLCET